MESMCGKDNFSGIVLFCYPDIRNCRLLIVSYLREKRKKLGLTQEGLANQCHLTKNTISNYETGTYGFDYAQVCYIEDFFRKFNIFNVFGHKVFDEPTDISIAPIVSNNFKKRV